MAMTPPPISPATMRYLNTDDLSVPADVAWAFICEAIELVTVLKFVVLNMQESAADPFCWMVTAEICAKSDALKVTFWFQLFC